MNQGDRRKAARVPAGSDGGWITGSEPLSCSLLVGTELGLWDLMLSDKSPLASCALRGGQCEGGRENDQKERGRRKKERQRYLVKVERPAKPL